MPIPEPMSFFEIRSHCQVLDHAIQGRNSDRVREILRDRLGYTVIIQRAYEQWMCILVPYQEGLPEVRVGDREIAYAVLAAAEDLCQRLYKICDSQP